MILSLVRAGAAALALAVFTSPGDAQTPNVKFTLDFAIQGQQSPFVLAAEGGYFARAGVNVQVDRGYGSADAITKVASGAYDMAFADIGALIQFNGKQAGGSGAARGSQRRRSRTHEANDRDGGQDLQYSGARRCRDLPRRVSAAARGAAAAMMRIKGRWSEHSYPTTRSLSVSR
jgi:NMT1/THI5 like